MLICLSGGAGLPAVPIAASATTVAAIPATVTSATAAAAFTATTAIAVTATATTAAAIAVTATTTATAWAATTEAARGPLFFGTGFHYLDRAATKVLTVQAADGGIRFRIVRHFNKAKSAGPAAFTVCNNTGAGYSAEGFEGGS